MCALANFAVKVGARDDTGTDRPTLLQQMMHHNLSTQYGFTYHNEGLLNDLPTLQTHLEQGHFALCNVRRGHIVALVGIKTEHEIPQVLVIDANSESDDERVVNNVTQAIEGTEICVHSFNKHNVLVSSQTHYALYYVPLSVVMDYNLLYKVQV